MQNSTWHRLLATGALAVPVAGAAQGPQPGIRELATIPGVEIEAAVAMPNGRILLYATGDSILAYDTRNRRGTFLTRGWAHQLRVAPAGDRLVFTGHDEKDEDIVMSMPIDPQTGSAAGPAQRVSISHGDEPSISPDGKMIAFGIQAPGGVQDLAVVPATGGPERILARYGPARIGETYWSADGKSVIAQVSRDSARVKWTLERVPATGGESKTVFPFTGNGYGSIDGQTLFRVPEPFNRAQREGRLTYTSASGAQGEFRIPRGAYLENNISSARSLAVVLIRDEWAHLVSLADGKLRELRPGSLASRGPAWSPDGRKIALHDSTGGLYGITVMSQDGSRSRHYSVSAFPNFMRWAPNGQALAYELEPKPGAPREIGVLDLTTGSTRVVSSTPNASLVLYHWRPDSRSLVISKWLTRSEGGPLGRQVFEASLSGSERLLRDISVEFPELTQRGGPISDRLQVLGTNLNSQHYLLSIDSGPLVKLPRLELRGFSGEPGVSQDGRWIAFLARNRNGPGTNVQLVSVTGDSLRVRLPFVADPSSFRPPFTPDGRSLILFGKLPGEIVSKIFSVPLDGSAPKALATLPTNSKVAGRLNLSPDGSAVVFTSVGPWTSKLYEIDVTPILQAIGKQ